MRRFFRLGRISLIQSITLRSGPWFPSCCCMKSIGGKFSWVISTSTSFSSSFPSRSSARSFSRVRSRRSPVAGSSSPRSVTSPFEETMKSGRAAAGSGAGGAAGAPGALSGGSSKSSSRSSASPSAFG